MNQCYVVKRFSAGSELIISQANEIIENYASQGYRLTLRQLFYQFVSKALIPNTMQSYKRLGSIINDARLAGLIDWDAIEDRTRSLVKFPQWVDPAHLIESSAQQYKIDLWKGQKFRPEVWVEKEALASVVERAADVYRVPFFCCRGYTSQSSMREAGQRFKHYIRDGQRPVVIYMGDHDPSGIDMTRDVDDRLRLFMGGLRVDRIALNMDQVEEFNPPPNPAKITDSRADNYIATFGEDSWELDAIEPTVMNDMITATIEKLIDHDVWAKRKKLEDAQRESLEEVSDKFDDVIEFLGLNIDEEGE